MDITFQSETRVSGDELALLLDWGAKALVIDCTVTRRSNRPFDLEVEGHTNQYPSVPGISFSAWLPLACIRELTKWGAPSVYRMSDYPHMGGDWSGIRDSADETVWAIFARHVLRRPVR